MQRAGGPIVADAPRAHAEFHPAGLTAAGLQAPPSAGPRLHPLPASATNARYGSGSVTPFSGAHASTASWPKAGSHHSGGDVPCRRPMPPSSGRRSGVNVTTAC